MKLTRAGANVEARNGTRKYFFILSFFTFYSFPCFFYFSGYVNTKTLTSILSAKTPPSRFQKVEGSIWATPASRDGKVARNKIHGFKEKVKELSGGAKKKEKTEKVEKAEKA
jgi:hypothetical protein